MKINVGSLELLEDFTKSRMADFLQKAESIGQAKLDELALLPKATQEVSFALNFFTPDGMQEINLQYRDVNAPTDVLSFPLWEDENGNFAPPENWEELALGDILVCPEVVAKNAKDNGKSFDEELALVIFHGLLHLCGYDHDTQERQTEMWQLQDEMVGEII